MNVKLLRKIKRHVLDEPKRVDMSTFISRKSDRTRVFVQSFPRCGTVGCIAGWAVTLSTDEAVDYGCIEDRAKKLLDIDSDQSVALFYHNRWPTEYQRLLGATKRQTKAHAVAVAKRIEHFIKTGE